MSLVAASSFFACASGACGGVGPQLAPATATTSAAEIVASVPRPSFGARSCEQDQGRAAQHGRRGRPPSDVVADVAAVEPAKRGQGGARRPFEAAR